MAAFHFGCISCFRGRSFLWFSGKKCFLQTGSNSVFSCFVFSFSARLHCRILQIQFSPLCANSADHFHLLNTPPGRPCLPSICADTTIFDCMYLKCAHAFSLNLEPLAQEGHCGAAAQPLKQCPSKIIGNNSWG